MPRNGQCVLVPQFSRSYRPNSASAPMTAKKRHDHEAWGVSLSPEPVEGAVLRCFNNNLTEHVHGDVRLTGVVEGGALGERVVESDVGCDGP